MYTEVIQNLTEILKYLDDQKQRLAAIHIDTAITILSKINNEDEAADNNLSSTNTEI